MDTIIVDGACSPYEWHYPVATSDIWILITHGLIDIRDRFILGLIHVP